MIRHLYRRTIEKNGKKIKVWYYWFYDENGKQVRKSCGKKGKPCLTKREAEEFLASLDSDFEDKKKTFNVFTKDFYSENSNFIIRKKQRGFEYAAHTIENKERALKHFLNKFGNRNPANVSQFEIEDWYYNSKFTPAKINCIITILNDVYTELYRHRIVKYQLKFEYVKYNNYKKKGILTEEEIKKLFPDDKEELIKIWGKNEDVSLMFATLTYLILSTGVRSGEARAIQNHQFLKDNVLLLDGVINSENERISILKKGSREDKRWRIVILPKKTIDMINYYKMRKNDNSDFLFLYNNAIIDRSKLNLVFQNAMKNIGIDYRERKITIHSLRYTFNTIMNKKMKGDDLRLLMGHRSEKMTEYYDRSTIYDNIPSLLKNSDIINSVFN
jgi:integrase